MRQLVFKFPDRETAEKFLEWLNGQGEQHYYNDLELRRELDLFVKFKYDYRNLIVDCKKISLKEKKK